MSDRWYLPLSTGTRPVQLEDLGSLLTITGVLVEGGGLARLLLLPSSSGADGWLNDGCRLSLEEWGEVIAATDDPQLFVGEEGGLRKALHRKARYEISGFTQQQVWARDRFACLYCGARMGAAQLTVDHFVPLELGGANDVSNYVSACRRCNKRKGMLAPEDYLDPETYEMIRAYLRSQG